MYTYSDSERIETHSKLVVFIVAFAIAFVIFIMILIGVGLSRGDELDFEEKPFLEYSTLEEPSATCLEHHREVLSTVAKYDAFVEDCRWTVDDEWSSDDFQAGVVVLYFVKDTVVRRPVRFFDYPFMVDDTEVIRVRYRTWPNQDEHWYIYMIQMTKDQIDSAEVIFD